jgi:hypothetical protein
MKRASQVWTMVSDTPSRISPESAAGAATAFIISARSRSMRSA